MKSKYSTKRKVETPTHYYFIHSPKAISKHSKSSIITHEPPSFPIAIRKKKSKNGPTIFRKKNESLGRKNIKSL